MEARRATAAHSFAAVDGLKSISVRVIQGIAHGDARCIVFDDGALNAVCIFREGAAALLIATILT